MDRAVANAGKVGARQARGVGVVKDKGAVAKECTNALLERGKLVDVRSREDIDTIGNLAMLAAQVADLTGLGGVRITGGFLATLVGVQVGQR